MMPGFSMCSATNNDTCEEYYLLSLWSWTILTLVSELLQHLKQQQEGLSHLISIIKDDLEDIKLIEHGLNESIPIRGGVFSWLVEVYTECGSQVHASPSKAKTVEVK